MDKKQKIIAIVILSVIIICLILFFSIRYNNKGNLSDNASNSNDETENLVDYQPQTAGYGDSSRYVIEITGISKELETKIPDTGELYLKIRDYMYENGLVQATKAEFEKSKISSDEIKMRFKINDDENTKLIVTFNLLTNQYNIYHY